MLVKKKVEEELEKRKDEIEQEVAKRVEEAKRKMEKQMMEELEREREQQRREELARQVTAAARQQSCATAIHSYIAFTHDPDPNHSAITIFYCSCSFYTLCTVLISTLYANQLMRVLFRSYLLKVQSGVVRVLTYKNFLITFF